MGGAKWEIVSRTPHLAIPDISKMPLPAQVVFRALQHFASKAADGADVVLNYVVEDSKPFLECRTKSSWFVAEYTNDTLILRFVKRKGTAGDSEEVRVKQTALRIAPNTARDIIYHLSIIFADAICNLYVHSTPELDALFNLSPSQ
jgi:hypothetical protein